MNAIEILVKDVCDRLPQVQELVLLYIYKNPRCRVMEIARSINASQQIVGVAVRRLAKRGYIYRDDNDYPIVYFPSSPELAQWFIAYLENKNASTP